MDREQFCIEAVFSDETGAFVSPQEPEKYDTVTIVNIIFIISSLLNPLFDITILKP